MSFLILSPRASSTEDLGQLLSLALLFYKAFTGFVKIWANNYSLYFTKSHFFLLLDKECYFVIPIYT